MGMAMRIPFDDRVNHHSSVTDLSFALIREFLEEVKSELQNEAAHMTSADLALQMHIASDPPEAILPLKAGLLFFSDKPERFFRGAITEVGAKRLRVTEAEHIHEMYDVDISHDTLSEVTAQILSTVEQ